MNGCVVPPLRTLGTDLLRVPGWRRLLTLTIPFVWCAAYFAFALWDCWPLAILAVVALSFVTYGSTSHDLVHRTLGLPDPVNDILLCVIELLALRSGHAYQAAHLNHHVRYPHSDDVEATAAGKSWLGALLEGPGFQFRVWWWALRHAPRVRMWVLGEGIGCSVIVVIAVAAWPVSPIGLTYVGLVISGSWIIPLVTSYVPHDPHGKDELSQTRAFRGIVVSIIALEHLYHLEHHLYPTVPHHNWPELARRLNPYLANAGVKPIKLWF